MDRFFDFWFPKIFIGMFILIGISFVVQIVFFVATTFWLATDPNAASTIGNELGDLIRPIANAVKGN